MLWNNLEIFSGCRLAEVEGYTECQMVLELRKLYLREYFQGELNRILVKGPRTQIGSKANLTIRLEVANELCPRRLSKTCVWMGEL